MTHSTVTTDEENAGSLDVVYHTINITSLDSAGTEQYDAASETGLSGADIRGVSVRGTETNTHLVRWDHTAEEFHVQDVADGTDTANNTNVGEVVLEVVGA
jgi:hypothetical protein